MTHVLILLEDEAHSADLRDTLERAGYHCTCPPAITWTPPGQLPTVELVLCDASLLSPRGEPLYKALHPLCKAIDAKLVGVVISDDEETLAQLMDCPPDAILVEPMPRDQVLARLQSLRLHSPSPESSGRNLLHDLVRANQRLRNENEQLALASVTPRRIESGSAPKMREELYRALFEQTQEAVFILNPRGLILDLNHSAEKLLARSRQEVLGEVMVLYRGRDVQGIVPTLARLHPGETATIDGARLQAQGKSMVLTIRNVPTAGEPRTLVLAHTITDAHPRVDPWSLQREKQALLGAIVSGLAHEISNPVAYVQANLLYLQEHQRLLSTFLHTMEEEFDRQARPNQWQSLLHNSGIENSPQEMNEALTDAIGGCQRIGELVRDMKSVARPDDEPPSEFALTEVLERALNLAAPVMRSRARLTHTLDKKLPTLLGHPGRLTHTFLSLLIAMAHHLEEGESAEHELRLTARHDNEQVCIQFSIEGPPHRLTRTLLPHKHDTRRNKRENSGQPISEALLASSRTILEEHNGHLVVQLNPGYGTVIEAILPIHQTASLTQHKDAALPREAFSSSSLFAHHSGEDW